MLLRRGPGEKLRRVAEVATRLAAPTDALALAEAARLKLTGTVGNAVRVDEAKMTAPHPEGASALEGCTTHETNPSRGQPRTAGRRPAWLRLLVIRFVNLGHLDLAA